MTRPTHTATWDSNFTNLIAPLSGHITDGYEDSEIPTASEENGWKNIVGTWTEYVNAGNFSDLSAVFSSLTISSDISGTPNFADTPTFATGLTSSGSLKGTKLLYTSADDEVVPVLDYKDPNASHTGNANGTGIIMAASSNRIIVPVRKPAGTILTAYNVYFHKTSSGSHSVAARLYKTHPDGTESTAGISFSNTLNAPGDTEIAASGDPITLLASYQYYLVLTPSGVTGDTLYGTELFFTRPS